MRPSNLTFLSIAFLTLQLSVTSYAQSDINSIKFSITPIEENSPRKCKYLDIIDRFAICSDDNSIRFFEYNAIKDITVVNKGKEFAISNLSWEKFQKLAAVVNNLNSAKRLATGGDKQDIAEGLYQLGINYFSGKGISKDYTKAKTWFLEAANLGHVVAQNDLGTMYYNGKGGQQNYAAALEWFTKAARQGYASAQNNIGLMYYNGEGVKQDFREAFKWYRKAAEQGHVDAQYSVGFMYRSGEGVVKDYQKSIKWYRKSAEQGDTDALNNLGFMYKSGKGVKQDYVEAVKMYKKAAEQGGVTSQNNLKKMYKSGKGVRPDESINWNRKLAKQDDIEAQNNLGFMYYNGEKGVEQNYNEAFKWFKKAAEQGDVTAQNMVGKSYLWGNGVKQDYREAVKWLKRAVEQDHPEALSGLAKIYYLQYKHGTNYNLDESDKCHAITTTTKNIFMNSTIQKPNYYDFVNTVNSYFIREQKRCVAELSRVRDKEAMAYVLSEIYKSISSHAPDLDSRCLTLLECYNDDFASDNKVRYNSNDCFDLVQKCQTLQQERVMRHPGFNSFN